MMSSEEYVPETIEDLKARGKSCGFTVVEATDYDLLLDLDTGAAYDQYKKNKSRVDKIFEFASVTEWESKSGNKHVLIKLKNSFPPEVRISLELILGSDTTCELLRLKSVLMGRPVLCLFKPKKVKE